MVPAWPARRRRDSSPSLATSTRLDASGASGRTGGIGGGGGLLPLLPHILSSVFGLVSRDYTALFHIVQSVMPVHLIIVERVYIPRLTLA